MKNFPPELSSTDIGDFTRNLIIENNLDPHIFPHRYLGLVYLNKILDLFPPFKNHTVLYRTLSIEPNLSRVSSLRGRFLESKDMIEENI